MDLQKRIDAFNKELGAVQDKHLFKISTETIIQDGLIVSKIVAVDSTPKPKPETPKEVKEVKQVPKNAEEETKK